MVQIISSRRQVCGTAGKSSGCSNRLMYSNITYMTSILRTLWLLWLETQCMCLYLTFYTHVVQRLNYKMDDQGNGVLFQTGAEIILFSTALDNAWSWLLTLE